MIRGVTFDWWGTIAVVPSSMDSDRMRTLRISRLAAALAALGHDADSAVLYHAYDRQSEELEKAWARYVDPSPSEQVRTYLRFAGLDGDDPRIADAVDEAFGGALTARLPDLFPHVADVLERLTRDGYVLGMVSNSGRTWGRYLRKVHEALAIGPYFRVRVFSDEQAVRKPDRRIFEAALEQMELPSGDVVHIGDDVTADIAGAKDAGMRAIWFNTGFWLDADGSTADAEIHDHSEVREVLERWRG